MTRLFGLLCFALICSLTTAPAGAAAWGDLSGTFLYDGPRPTSAPISITKDVAICGKHKLVDESLVVSPKGGLKNVVLYLYLRSGSPKPSIHESYAKTAKEEIVLDNSGCRFEPHILLLRTTQTLLIGNKDAVGHNTKADTFSNPPFNDIIPAGGVLNKQMSAPERLPTTISCSIHPWMNARLVVKDNPYMAVTDNDGKFVIENLPTGKWTFQVWHETSGYVSQVKKDSKATSWRRGRVEITIKPGPNDLGVIKVAPSLFEK